MKTISVELSVESCNAAVKELQEYQKKIKPKIDEVCRRLAEIGAQEARGHISGAHGNGAVSIMAVPMPNGYKVVASGQDVYFVEFGTGNNVSPHGESVSVPVYPGSWSEGHAKQFSEKGFWFYGGERLEGTPAEMPMYYAGRAIRENAKRVVQEVFGN